VRPLPAHRSDGGFALAGEDGDALLLGLDRCTAAATAASAFDSAASLSSTWAWLTHWCGSVRAAVGGLASQIHLATLASLCASACRIRACCSWTSASTL